MSDPLSYLPYALGAAGGRVDQFEASTLVAAGLTLLQRCAPLVKSMSGRRAAILLPTSPQFLTALAACDGRDAVLINPLAALPEVAWQLNDANVGAVFTVEALVGRIPVDVAAHMPIVMLDASPRSADVQVDQRVRTIDLGSHAPLSLEGARSAPGSDDPCVIVYTSAMAGRARGAILSHRSLLANARSTVTAAAMQSDDHALALLPFSHLFGLTVSGNAPLLASARVTTMPRFQPLRALELIETEGITQLVGVPAVYAALIQAMERRGPTFRDHALRVCICGGAALPQSLQDRFADVTGVELRQGYGLTEAAPVALFNCAASPNIRGTLGVAFPDVEVSIRDHDHSVALPTAVVGEICVRGPNVFSGYVHGATDALHVVDGWLHTGDQGVRNDDGTVTFVGLIKPMFTRNGFNIYPRELERVIGEMPGVMSVQVYSTPDEVREHGIGVRVSGAVMESDVKAWCEMQLSAYKQPTVIEIIER